MSTRLSEDELSVAVRLLKKNSSIHAMSTFLKRRELVSSAGSWDALVDLRLKPALSRGELGRDDIVRLLRDSEEFGRQHVFLYRCPRAEAANLTNEPTIRRRLAAMGIESLLSHPRIVEAPRGLQLVDVRLEPFKNRTSLVVKAVDVRRHRELIGSQTTGTTEVLTYALREERAVNVIRVSSDGATEVRIQSHRNAVDYAVQAENFFAKCTGIVDRLQFEDFSLAKARLNMIKNRKQLSRPVRFGENMLRSKKGGAVRVSTGSWSKNMFDDDEELDGSVDTFISKGRGRTNCDTVNCTWLRLSDNSGPLSDIHTFIGGANNEFVIIPQCERLDYEYVLEKITSLSE